MFCTGNQTLIKRTFYQESIISGTNVELPQLEQLLESQRTPNTRSTMTTTKSASSTKLTTRVTLNLCKVKRRSSDLGLFTYQRPTEVELPPSCSPRMTDMRHSICGNELFEVSKCNGGYNETGRTASRQSLEQIVNSPNAIRALYNAKSDDFNYTNNSMGFSNSDISQYSRLQAGTYTNKVCDFRNRH